MPVVLHPGRELRIVARREWFTLDRVNVVRPYPLDPRPPRLRCRGDKELERAFRHPPKNSAGAGFYLAARNMVAWLPTPYRPNQGQVTRQLVFVPDLVHPRHAVCRPPELLGHLVRRRPQVIHKTVLERDLLRRPLLYNPVFPCPRIKVPAVRLPYRHEVAPYHVKRRLR